MSAQLQTALDWLLDRLAENSTWRGIVGALAACGAVWASDPVKSSKIIAAGMGIIAAINLFRKAPPSKVQVADALATKVDKPEAASETFKV